MSISQYLNAPYELSKRSMIPEESPRLVEMIDALMVEFKKHSVMYYCGNHHSIETRNSVKHHNNCQKFTKASLIGKIIHQYTLYTNRRYQRTDDYKIQIIIFCLETL